MSMRWVSEATFVETPQGIFTAAGVVFRTTTASLGSFAGAVFEKVSLAYLLAYAEVWLRSAKTLALWALPLLLLVVSPGVAAALALGLYVVWQLVSPAVFVRSLLGVFALGEQIWAQGVLYIGLMSWLGNQGALLAVAVGMGGFMLLRWGVVERALYPVTEALRSKLYDHAAPDLVLRSVITQTAYAHALPVGELAFMEKAVIDHLVTRNQKKNKRKSAK